MDMDMSSAYPHHWLSFSLSNNYHHGLLEAFSNSSSAPPPPLGKITICFHGSSLRPLVHLILRSYRHAWRERERERERERVHYEIFYLSLIDLLLP
jgi:hypothetical protein